MTAPSDLDDLALRDPATREASLFAALPSLIASALNAPGWAAHLGALDPASITDRAALARLPVLRKSDLPALQRANPPFGGMLPSTIAVFGRLFTSPGPIFEPEGVGADAWGTARGLRAAGFRSGDIALNTFSYHLTPGGFIMDAGLRALGCPVIPAGPGNTDQILDVIEHLRPVAYCGTGDFLKILLDKARVTGRDVSSITKGIVSGAAYPQSLAVEIDSRGVSITQLFATADLGLIAYETLARDGLVLNENLILEIVRPGTGKPVADGEVGEMVLTSLHPDHPLIRLAIGDLTATLPGFSATGHTNTRIKGWMGRADQTAKIKGMFVRPEQIAEIAARHSSIARLRLVVTRVGEQDAMTLQAESDDLSPLLAAALGEALQSVTKLKGAVEIVALGTLPNDGKVIADERPIG